MNALMQCKLCFQPALASHMLGPICTINCELLSVVSAVPGYEHMGLNALDFQKIHTKRNIIEILLSLFQPGGRLCKAQCSNMFKWRKLWNALGSSRSSNHCQARRLAPKKCKEGILCVGVTPLIMCREECKPVACVKRFWPVILF